MSADTKFTEFYYRNKRTVTRESYFLSIFQLLFLAHTLITCSLLHSIADLEILFVIQTTLKIPMMMTIWTSLPPVAAASQRGVQASQRVEKPMLTRRAPRCMLRRHNVLKHSLLHYWKPLPFATQTVCQSLLHGLWYSHSQQWKTHFNN